MKITLMLVLLGTTIPAIAAPIYKCGNLYTDDVKLCSTPVVLSPNAVTPPAPDASRTCQPNTCTITKESK